jgi:hypothetical protein
MDGSSSPSRRGSRRSAMRTSWLPASACAPFPVLASPFTLQTSDPQHLFPVNPGPQSADTPSRRQTRNAASVPRRVSSHKSRFLHSSVHPSGHLFLPCPIDLHPRHPSTRRFPSAHPPSPSCFLSTRPMLPLRVFSPRPPERPDPPRLPHRHMHPRIRPSFHPGLTSLSINGDRHPVRALPRHRLPPPVSSASPTGCSLTAADGP